jgi:hypothetical protein
MLIEKLLVSITFHYVKERLKYLSAVCGQLSTLAFEVKLLVVTNTSDPSLLDAISDSIGSLPSYEIVNYPVMGHPYFLTWGYQHIFKDYFFSDLHFSHFMYLEDDILVTAKNIDYWLRGRNYLKNTGLYPSFVRFEVNDFNGEKYATDITKNLSIRKMPFVKISCNYGFINSPQPYQGMFLMDREMMGEYLNSLACTPDFGEWGIREKATQGLTYVEIPKGFFSRNLIGCNFKKREVDPGTLVHHLPNNYTNNATSMFGKIRIQDLISR